VRFSSLAHFFNAWNEDITSEIASAPEALPGQSVRLWSSQTMHRVVNMHTLQTPSAALLMTASLSRPLGQTLPGAFQCSLNVSSLLRGEVYTSAVSYQLRYWYRQNFTATEAIFTPCAHIRTKFNGQCWMIQSPCCTGMPDAGCPHRVWSEDKLSLFCWKFDTVYAAG
jgi:hypothetical protein